jgi:iron(III) transport system substrate-binding protein
MTFLFYVNRDVVPESELSSVEQLVEPRWSGRITSVDPRNFSAASAHTAHLLLLKGEDWIRRLMGQELVVVGDNRQLVDFVVRGRYPIGFGLTISILEQFQREGTGRNVKPLAPQSEPGTRYTTGNGSMALISKAPHPNAARVYVNWLLSREAHASWVKIVAENTRRLDVAGGPPDTAPRPGAYLKDVNREENMPYVTRAMEVAKSVIP